MDRPGANTYAPKQPELPAWLETLRSSERPPTPATSGSESQYSIGDSIDENTLPSWMRSDIIDQAQSAKLPAIRPASRPAPNTEGGFANPVGMSASSLIDEQSLPSWMQEQQPQAPSQVVRESISAASLVQPDAMPTWMKAVPPQQQPTTASISQQTQYAPPVIPPQGLSGNDLIDQQALPPWMSAQGNGRVGQGMVNGSSLIDANALPLWLREGEQQEQRSAGTNVAPGILGMGAAPMPQAGQPGQSRQPMQAPNIHNNISASSFIDMDALPNWLRPAEEQHGATGGNTGNTGEQGRAGAFGPSARVENMRVPSRPRVEMPSIEESAVAANVFASMLGVASANVPGQSPNEALRRGQPGQSRQPQNGQIPQSALPAQSPYPIASPQTSTNNGASGANWSGFPEGSMAGQLPPLVPPPGYAMPMQQNMSNSQYGHYGQSGQGNQPAMPQPSLANNFQGNQGNQGVLPQMPGNNFQGKQSPMPQPSTANNFQSKQPQGGQQKQSGKKRGFLETILNWFPFSR